MKPIRKGSTGPAVKGLQTMLNLIGFGCGKVDGKYGRDTEDAIRAFQRANSLRETGDADESTLEIIAFRAASMNTSK